MDTSLMTLAALRERMRYSQEEAADKLGISTATLRKWEQDSSGVTARQMSQLEKLYCYPMDKTFYGDNIAFSEVLRSPEVA